MDRRRIIEIPASPAIRVENSVTHAMLKPSQAAKYLGFSEPNLPRWRHDHKGPKYFRARNGRVYYAQEDLDEWAQAHPYGYREQTAPSLEELVTSGQLQSPLSDEALRRAESEQLVRAALLKMDPEDAEDLEVNDEERIPSRLDEEGGFGE